MTVYRILFFELKKGTAQHFDSTAAVANHYHITKNNKNIGECSLLRNAVEKLIEDAGDNEELQGLLDHVFFLQNPETRYICIGITYGEKHGVKLEMRVQNDNI